MITTLTLSRDTGDGWIGTLPDQSECYIPYGAIAAHCRPAQRLRLTELHVKIAPYRVKKRSHLRPGCRREWLFYFKKEGVIEHLKRR